MLGAMQKLVYFANKPEEVSALVRVIEGGKQKQSSINNAT
jgi:hypothetical protein